MICQQIQRYIFLMCQRKITLEKAGWRLHCFVALKVYRIKNKNRLLAHKAEV